MFSGLDQDQPPEHDLQNDCARFGYGRTSHLSAARRIRFEAYLIGETAGLLLGTPPLQI